MRKLIKFSYLFIIKFINLFCKVKPKARHMTILMTFEEDVIPLAKASIKEGYTVTLLYHPKYTHAVLNPDGKYYELFKASKKIALSNRLIIQQMRAILTSKVIVIDTYYLMLGSMKRSASQTVIQLWHATSAMKQFGLQDKHVDLNNKPLIQQYQSVYDYTDTYVVAGDYMIDIFKQSFNAHDKYFLKTGLPRLEKRCTAVTDIRSTLPNITAPYTLFVPTYREYHLDDKLRLTHDALPNLIIKAHPSDRNYQTDILAKEIPTENLMEHADVVITDYSSLLVEAIYKGNRVYCYAPDEAQYNQERGLSKYYYNLTHKKAQTVAQLQQLMQHDIEYDIQGWVNYQTDHATQSIMAYIKEVIH
ncbi:CDP-glycerol glycerophosphotransferase family protein [Macrococcus capreoli]|uniref:CDP-glycerol glycerophosphotransferase family protein n=1 Tax=Macrococcus capreoli TaxID=2982690 RepID=UPI003EE49B4B